jgi:hypothetical protein
VVVSRREKKEVKSLRKVYFEVQTTSHGLSASPFLVAQNQPALIGARELLNITRKGVDDEEERKRRQNKYLYLDLRR